MITKKISILSGITLLSLAILTSCGALLKPAFAGKDLDVPLKIYNGSVPYTYRDIDRSIAIVVNSSVTKENMYDDSNLSKKTRAMLPVYNFTPAIPTFAKEASTTYLQQMHFDVRSNADYRLEINTSKFQLAWISDKEGAKCDVTFSYRLVDESRETIVPNSTVSSSVTLAQTEDFGDGFGRAYYEAFKKVNWDRIADALRVEKSAKKEPNAQVEGSGNTALEHTVIRWNIISSPQGADVSWRVVSSTPDVSNTNSNYVGTTPYESTESFDIKGLTYNNAGNVQIEVTCERPGYLSQKKRFNLRQAIDQKEISAKFNLVKDE